MYNYWHRKKDKLKQLYPFIKDKDLNYRLGEEVKMIETLGKKIGKSQKELLRMIVML